ncbi:MAG: TIGR03032 family protein [Thermoanaerobaculia bacterium]
MRLETELVRLPLRFDAGRLAAEAAGVPEGAWRPHPQGHPGNSALPLIAANGDPADDQTKGPMLPTPHLAGLPYLRQVLAAFQAPIGRTRLMRLDGNAEATAHADVNYYWMERLRVHVPVVTTPGVEFVCGGRSAHMAAGEAWVFDTWRIHNVLNPDPTRRIHLVADTVASPELWDLIENGEQPFADPPRSGAPPRFVPWRPGVEADLATERVNQPVVMTPWEQERLIEPLLREAGSDDLSRTLQGFLRRWRSLWAVHGEREAGWPAYRAELEGLEKGLAKLAPVRLPNGLNAVETVRHVLVRPGLNPDLAMAPRPVRRPDAPRRFERPVFIVCPPRSGSSLLFETLAQSPSVWTVGGESHNVIEQIPALHPSARGWDSNRLTAADARPQVVERLTDGFFLHLRDRDGRRPLAGAEGLRLLEKTPKNALRVPFLAEAFPDARFVYLYRNPREAISSIYEAWKSGRFVTYPELPGWSGPPWSLLLVPGWRELAGRDLPEIAARQWTIATRRLLDDLEALPPERWCVANYGRLASDPREEIERLRGFLGLDWDRVLTAPLPPSRHTLTPPEPGKWRRNEAILEPVFPLAAEMAERAQEVFARRPGHAPMPAKAAASPPPAPKPAPAGGSPLRSAYTSSLPALLQALGSSLLVSTYQSGRVIVVRADGASLNTHFRTFPSPMGLALGPRYLAIGTARHIWEYRNVPAAARRLQPQDRHDACFLPRASHVTGDIQVHEMAFAGDELWVVNTRFSCLCVLDQDHSFVPRWRPPFVSALAPEDRCHLNGMAVVDGRVRFVTALGRTDTPQGWREAKAHGGVLLDVPSGEVVASGLSMPHSPRWHDGRLWVLESGNGEIGVVDPATGRAETVAQLPGFTRGLAFAGPYAFVGLSQVRESVFGGLPLSERLEDRACGVWVIDTRSGETVGFLRFDDAVQEIFEVALLPGLRFPELAEPEGELIGSTWVLPEEALAEVALTPRPE